MIAHTSYPDPVQYTSTNLTAALAYARRDVPVFPVHSIDGSLAGTCTCKAGAGCTSPGKHPRVINNLENATKDPEQIRRWWSRWPNANIGIPTGRRSGISSLDLDTYKPGAWTPEDIERELGPIPETATIKTGSGGRQFWFKHPEGENLKNGIPENVLGPGVCIKADGGYVLAPPSATTSPYKTINKAPRAAPPEWFLEALKPDPRTSHKPPATPRPRSAPAPLGETIPEGGRNAGLTRVAGRLRSQGYGGPELLAELERINADQCSPPLPAPEVLKIARSAELWPVGTASPGPGPEVLEALERIARDLLNYRAWPGVGGKTERSIIAALVVLARQHGQLCPAGVRVEVSFRDLALKAAVSLSTVTRAIFRLKASRGEPGEERGERGILRADNLDRRPEEGGALVLLHRGSGQGDHTPTTGSALEGLAVVGGVVTLTTPRLRNSAPGILRLGKTGEAIVDHLDASRGGAGWVDVPDLAALMGSTSTRYIKRHVIPRLVEAGIATLDGDRLAFTADWRGALDRERERAGEIERYRLDLARYDREREAYRTRHEHPPEAVPEPETRPAPVQPPKETPASGDNAAHNTLMATLEDREADPPEATGPEGSLSALAVAVRDYLDANPKDRRQPPGWIGLTLWAFGLVAGKPTPADIRAALDELHGRVAA